MTTNTKTIIFDIGFMEIAWSGLSRTGLAWPDCFSESISAEHQALTKTHLTLNFGTLGHPGPGHWSSGHILWHFTLAERRRHLYFMTFCSSGPSLPLPISLNICHRHHTLRHLRVGISQHYQASRRADTGSWPLTQVSDWQLRTQHSNLVPLRLIIILDAMMSFKIFHLECETENKCNFIEK